MSHVTIVNDECTPSKKGSIQQRRVNRSALDAPLLSAPLRQAITEVKLTNSGDRIEEAGWGAIGRHSCRIII
jgi:hypothetical protein